MTREPTRVGDPTDAVLAVDVGGTKLAVALVSASGALLARRAAPTPRPTGPPAAEDLWRALASLVESLLAAPAAARVVACGVGCGGPMSPGGELVSPLHIPAWRAFPLRDRLAALAGVPTWVDNDAK